MEIRLHDADPVGPFAIVAMIIVGELEFGVAGSFFRVQGGGRDALVQAAQIPTKVAGTGLRRR